MNNFRRSVEEIVQVVKIADTTLKKRLEEFKSTPSGALTLADFRNVWLEEEMDPPAFTRGKEKEETERTASQHDEVGDDEDWQKKAKAKKKMGDKLRKKRRREGEMEEPERDEPVVQEAIMHSGQPFNTTILRDSILASAIDPESLRSSPTLVDGNSNIDPVLLQESVPSLALSNSSITHPVAPPVDLVEEQVSQVLAEEVTNFLKNPQGTKMTGALDEAEERRLAQMAVVDELKNLNEEELDHFILSEEEVKIKERVWVELNRDYLEALAGALFETFR